MLFEGEKGAEFAWNTIVVK